MLPLKELRPKIEDIKNKYGIELNSSEIVSLSFYLLCFRGRWEEEREKYGLAGFVPHTTAVTSFMENYFDMEDLELGRSTIMLKFPRCNLFKK